MADESSSSPPAVPADGSDEQQSTTSAATTPVALASLSRLAAVELQLIMQHCDRQSLLAMARCSRAVLRSASTPFAWSHCLLLEVREAAPDLPARLAGPLLRHCPLALTLSSPGAAAWQRPPVSNEELRAIVALPCLRSLDTRSRTLHRDAFAELLKRPATAGLTALYTSRNQLDSECTALLPLHQRGLRSLHVEAPGAFAAPDFFAPLPLLPALTDLSVVATATAACGVRAVANCGGLRQLTLDSLPSDDVQTILTAATMRGLESLTLQSVRLDGDAAASVLRNCPALRLLHLRCSGVDALLPIVAAHCPSLRELRITPQRLGDEVVPFGASIPVAGSALPSAAEMERLLVAMPQLAALVLQLPPPPSTEGDDSVAPWMPPPVDRMAQWQRAHAHFDSFRQLHPQRVRLLIRSSPSSSSHTTKPSFPLALHLHHPPRTLHPHSVHDRPTRCPPRSSATDLPGRTLTRRNFISAAFRSFPATATPPSFNRSFVVRMSKRNSTESHAMLSQIPVVAQPAAGGLCNRVAAAAAAADAEQSNSNAVAASAACLSHLATVELQLVMHGLDRQSLLRLARCSRLTFQAASADFAWKHLSPLSLSFPLPHLVAVPPSCARRGFTLLRSLVGAVLSFTGRDASEWPMAQESPPPSTGSLLSASLLRHCDLRLDWLQPRGRRQASWHRTPPPVSADELADVMSVRRVVMLDARDRPRLTAAQLDALTADPAFSGRLSALMLSVLPQEDGSTATLAAALGADRLPRLRVLSLGPLHPGRLQHIDQWLQLSPLPQLTALSLDGQCAWRTGDCDVHWVREHSSMQASGGPVCDDDATGLRALRLSDLDASLCRSLLADPRLRRLEELALADVQLSDDEYERLEEALGAESVAVVAAAFAASWSACFAGLPELRTLRLDRVESADTIIGALLQLPAGVASMRQLRVVTGPPVEPQDDCQLADGDADGNGGDGQSMQPSFPIPSAALLRDLLDSQPLLHVDVTAPAAFLCGRHRGVSECGCLIDGGCDFSRRRGHRRLQALAALMRQYPGRMQFRTEP